MQQSVQAIGTVKDWVLKHGTEAEHSHDQMNATEAMLVEGAKSYRFDPPFQLIRRMVPVTCPGVWCIYMNTENNRHTKLYLKLADAAQRLQQLTNKEEQRQQRARNLRSIQIEMATELADWVRAQPMEAEASRATQSSEPPGP